MSDNKKLDAKDLDNVSGGGTTANFLPHCPIWVDTTVCTCCGNCEKVCLNVAIQEEGDSYDVNPYYCTGCGECINVCPVGAIHLE